MSQEGDRPSWRARIHVGTIPPGDIWVFAEFTYSALGFRTEVYGDIMLEVSRSSGRGNSLRS